MRTAPSAAVSPTVRNLEKAAGFLEGEGYFGPSGGRKNARGTSQSVVGSNNDPEMLRWLKSIFGGSVVLKRRLHNKGRDIRNWNQAYQWLVTGARARGVMMTLYDLMSTRKRQQIRETLAKWRSG